MKQKIHSFFRLLLFIITICGCEKKNLFDYDIVSGNYELVSIYLLSSQGLDLDGDGHATTDLYQEFSGVFDNVSAGLMDREVLKSSVSAVGTNRSISLRIPFQCISEWTLNGESQYNFHPYFQSLDVWYEVRDDGTFSIETFSPDWSNAQALDLRHISHGMVTIPEPGCIQLDMDCLFYDYFTESIVTGPVRFCFFKY